jgi:hypothetical protein
MKTTITFPICKLFHLCLPVSSSIFDIAAINIMVVKFINTISVPLKNKNIFLDDKRRLRDRLEKVHV